jgi:hypothetical protein
VQQRHLERKFRGWKAASLPAWAGEDPFGKTQRSLRSGVFSLVARHNLQDRGVRLELKFHPQHSRGIIRCAVRLGCFASRAVSLSSGYSQEKHYRKTQKCSRFLQEHFQQKRLLTQKPWISGAPQPEMNRLLGWNKPHGNAKLNVTWLSSRVHSAHFSTVSAYSRLAGIASVLL